MTDTHKEPKAGGRSTLLLQKLVQIYLLATE